MRLWSPEFYITCGIAGSLTLAVTILFCESISFMYERFFRQDEVIRTRMAPSTSGDSIVSTSPDNLDFEVTNITNTLKRRSDARRNNFGLDATGILRSRISHSDSSPEPHYPENNTYYGAHYRTLSTDNGYLAASTSLSDDEMDSSINNSVRINNLPASSSESDRELFPDESKTDIHMDGFHMQMIYGITEGPDEDRDSSDSNGRSMPSLASLDEFQDEYLAYLREQCPGFLDSKSGDGEGRNKEFPSPH